MPRAVSLALGLALLGCGLCGSTQATVGREVTVRSPDGNVQLVLRLNQVENKLLYSVERAGTPVIGASSLDLRLAGVGPLASGVTIENVSKGIIDKSSSLPWGKSSRIRNHCAWAIVRLNSASGVAWEVELRAYNDGVAFRYGFPKQKRLQDFVIEQELTEFRLSDDPTVFFTTCDGFSTSHEGVCQRKPLSELPEKLLDMPLLAVWKDGSAAAITEARVRNFADMYLERPAGFGPAVLRSRLSPLPSTGDACVLGRAPFWCPWRVILLGDLAGKLIESDLIVNLNEPPAGDFRWVKPGKSTWHWWNGTVETRLPIRAGMNLQTHKYYIDFCARHGITYHAVVADDRPWYVQSQPGYEPGPDTDILTPRPELELPEILSYAREKDVGIRLWVHWKPLSEKLDEALATYECWGVKGLMVDFMDRDDQEMVRFQEEVLRSAARHKLTIQFHGSYKPSGEQRTFPNLLNREGVLNLEYLKWSNLCAPPHNVMVAYTRLLAGPMDYHLGGFRAVSRREFQARSDAPNVLGTRCHHLAMYVVYENPMPMVCDFPSAYEGQTGFDFLAEVPTTWDETRFVCGEPGEYIVVARRKGQTWYLGGMTNWTARSLSIPLDFLGTGQYEASLYVDGSLDEERPNEIRLERRDVSAGTPLRVSLAPGGGTAAVFRPH
jgi:alpha-glucosidase